MKIKDILTERPKKKKKGRVDKYAPEDLLDSEKEMQKMVLANGKKIADYILKNCKPWLKETQHGKDWVYRGWRDLGSRKLAFTKLVRKDRKPLDTGDEGHRQFNQVIDICGKVANRSNALFVTGDIDVAEGYGSVYITIPVGDFNYTWHTKQSDWTGWEGEVEDDVQKAKLSSIAIDPKVKEKLVTKLRADYQKKYAKKVEKNPEGAKSITTVLLDAMRQVGFKGTLANLEHALGYYGTYALDSDSMKYSYEYKSYINDPYPDKARGYMLKLYHFSKKKPQIVKLLRAAQKKVQGASSSGKSDLDISSEKAYVKSGLEQYAEKIKDAEFKKYKGIHPEAVKQVICPVLKGDDGTLSQAIRMEHEIMISSEKAIAIQPVMYEYVVLPLLHKKKPAFGAFDIEDIFQDSGNSDDMW